VYSPKIIGNNLDIATQTLGYEPIYHSIAACDEAVEHFNERLSKHQDSQRPDDPMLYDQDELRWIENEKALCQYDYMYFATRYAWILNAEEEIIHYAPNTAQLIANDARAQLEDLGWAVTMMFLKARQAGITTDSQIVIAHRTFFWPNVIALTGSADKERSRDMVEKYKALYDNTPYFLRPPITTNRTGNRMEFGGQNSRLIIQHGAQKMDIGRGNTPSAFHLSEVASYDNAADLIDAGLMPAFHESPHKIGILESTGEGPFGWWYDTWEHCKKRYWDGGAKFRPVFLPWFVCTEFYPTKTWLKRSPVPAGWIPEAVVIAHAERARKFVRVNDLLRRYFPENWQMPKEQMWFWWNTREEYRAKKRLDRFLHEFAADDLEAFAASGESVFDVDTLSDYNHSCQEPVGIFGFRCSVGSLPARLQADERNRNPNRPILEVGPYQFVPLKWDGWAAADPMNKLLVFEWPEEGEEYGFGVDTSDGVGQDNSVIEGLRKGSLTRSDAQICEYANAYTNAVHLATISHAIASFYQQGRAKQPKISIEVNMNGEVTQLELRKLGWSNFHQWVRYDRKKITNKDATRLGWMTTRWSRAMLIDYLVKALRDGDIDINSPEFVKEMQALHRDEDMQSARAEKGHHDDRFMALGIIFVSLHILELTGKQASISYLRQRRQETGPMRYTEKWGEDVEIAVPTKEYTAVTSARMSDFFGSTAVWHPGQSMEHWEQE
jgi:hypothetical protein